MGAVTCNEAFAAQVLLLGVSYFEKLGVASYLPLLAKKVCRILLLFSCLATS